MMEKFESNGGFLRGMFTENMCAECVLKDGRIVELERKLRLLVGHPRLS